MADYIPQNNQPSAANITVDYFPDIVVADFKTRFSTLKEIDINLIVLALGDASDKVSHHLNHLKTEFATFQDFVNQHELSSISVNRLYFRAVHHKAVSDILATHITTSDTKDSEERQDNLQSRIISHDAQSRHAISQLLSEPIIYSEVV